MRRQRELLSLTRSAVYYKLKSGLGQDAAAAGEGGG